MTTYPEGYLDWLGIDLDALEVPPTSETLAESLAAYAKYRERIDADAALPTHIRKKAGPNLGTQYYSHSHRVQFMEGYVDPMSQTLCGGKASTHDLTWAETRHAKSRAYATCEACVEIRLRDPKVVR